MYETQFALLFGAGVLTSIGAYLGYARGYSAIMNLLIWIVLGNASTALQVRAGGSEVLYTSDALGYLCFLNAALSFIALLIAIQEHFADDQSGVTDASQLTDKFQIRN